MLHRLLLLSFLAPFSAHAIECESLSPTKEALGEQYYDLDNQADDTSDNQALIKRATEMLTKKRFRSGHATRVTCKRIDGELTAVTHQYELENAYTSSTSHGGLNMKVVVEDKVNRIVETQTLSLPNESGWLSGTNNNTLRMNHRYRVRNNFSGSSTSRLLEFDIELTVLNKGVDVKQLLYTNGLLVEQTNWTLFTR